MYRGNKVAAFTLLECLLALLLVSGSLLVVEGLSRLLLQEVNHQTHQIEKDWLVFANQLQTEWDGVRLVRVSDNRIYVDKAGQQLAFGKSKSDDFRKTNDKGQGYQPMLYGLQSAEISQSGNLVTIHFIFKNGKEREFVYAFAEKS